MNNLEVGGIVSAEVTDVTSHGVTIKFFDQKGFIQIPELSWDTYGLQARFPSICKIGDVVKVKVLSQTDEQFYASLRAATPELDPWNESNKLTTGQQLKGEVVLVADYGYLVKLPNFVVSMLPVEATDQKFKKGEIVDFRVASVDDSAQKVFLETSK
jgi:ribosomal protein S1